MFADCFAILEPKGSPGVPARPKTFQVFSRFVLKTTIQVVFLRSRPDDPPYKNTHAKSWVFLVKSEKIISTKRPYKSFRPNDSAWRNLPVKCYLYSMMLTVPLSCPFGLPLSSGAF